MPSEDNRPHLTRERAISVSDKIHGIANEIIHTNWFNEDETENRIAEHVEDQLEGLANVLSALARVCGEAWRIER